MTDHINLAFLRRVLGVIEAAAGSGRDVAIDTLHLTQSVRPGVLRRESFDEIDQRLAAVGAKVLTLNLTRDAIAARAVDGRRDTGFYEYISRFAGTDAGIVQHLQREQAAIGERAEHWSALPHTAQSGELPVTYLANVARSLMT
ncbi:MAG: hypothetical protein H6726_13550 [Sandaracinaceae bacterium]|nr:hypothetical protein [Sandaracinaceae bacterium]